MSGRFCSRSGIMDARTGYLDLYCALSSPVHPIVTLFWPNASAGARFRFIGRVISRTRTDARKTSQQERH